MCDVWSTTDCQVRHPAQYLSVRHRDRVVCLCGGPGRGKSHLLGIVIRFLVACKTEVSATAPTGKAAARLSECIDLPCQQRARTIHSVSHGNAEDALRGAYIVDELSMCDVTTLQMLLSSRASAMNFLVLSGDPDQLPSIGPGAVLLCRRCGGILGPGKLSLGAGIIPKRKA